MMTPAMTKRSLTLPTLLLGVFFMMVLKQVVDTSISLRDFSAPLCSCNSTSNDILDQPTQSALSRSNQPDPIQNCTESQSEVVPSDISSTNTITTTLASNKQSALSHPPGRKYLEPRIKPFWGSHRPTADAIFTMATGYEIDDHLLIFGSLFYNYDDNDGINSTTTAAPPESDRYNGDVVVGIQDWKDCTPALQAFLKYHAEHSHLVVYVIEGCQRRPQHERWGHVRCSMGYAYRNPYGNQTNPNAAIAKDLSGRHQSPRKFRYEHYWIWSRNYKAESRILLVDFRDLVFQGNPFVHPTIPTTTISGEFATTLYLFEESALRRVNELSRFTAKMMSETYGVDMPHRIIGNQTVLCSGVTLGGKTAMEQYLLMMIWEMDNFQLNKNGKGDQAHHNVLYYTGQLARQEGIDKVVAWSNLEGAVATIGDTYREHYSEGNKRPQVLDNHDNPIPIIHQFDRSRSLNTFFKRQRDKVWQPRAEKDVGRSLEYKPDPTKRKPS